MSIINDYGFPFTSVNKDRTAGTLATGVTTAKKYAVDFIYDGAAWIETGRTAAM